MIGRPIGKRMMPWLLGISLAAGSCGFVFPGYAEEISAGSDEAAMIAAAQAAAEEEARAAAQAAAAQAAAEEAARAAAEQAAAEEAARAAAAAQAQAEAAAGEGAGDLSSQTGSQSAGGSQTFTLESGDGDGFLIEELILSEDPSQDAEEKSAQEKALEELSLTHRWGEDLAAAAGSQLGVSESPEDTAVRGDGSTGGRTPYGEAKGAPYDPWCGAFVRYCLEKAQVDRQALLYEEKDGTWCERLREKGLYREGRDLSPEKGDLVFFHLTEQQAKEEGKETVLFDRLQSTDPEKDRTPNRVGIVARVGDGKLKVIEGDVRDAVRECTYELTDSSITGYVSMWAAQEMSDSQSAVTDEFGLIADLFAEDAPTDRSLEEMEEAEQDSSDAAPDAQETGQDSSDAALDAQETGQDPSDAAQDVQGAEEPSSDAASDMSDISGDTPRAGETVSEDVNVRQGPGTDTDVITLIHEAGTPLQVLGTVQVGEEIWARVEIGDITGYIRTDLLSIAELEPEKETRETETEAAAEIESEAETETPETETEAAAETGTEAETETPETETGAAAKTETEAETETPEIETEAVTESESETETTTEVETESETETEAEPTPEYFAQADELPGLIFRVFPEDPEKLPAGTVMKIRLAEDDAAMQSAQETLRESDQKDREVRAAVGIRIIFEDENGTEFVPDTRLRVEVQKTDA